MARIFSVCAVAVLLVAVMAGSALAAPAGKGKGHNGGGGGNGTSAAVLTVAPNPVPSYTQPTVSGSGFDAGEALLVGIPGDLRFTEVTPDDTGSFSFLYTDRELKPGTYTMEAWGLTRSGKWLLRADVTFEVV